jgi:putative oxidoreductase
VGHSTQKLFGWFSGAGRTATAATFEQWGLVPGSRLVVVAGLTELAGAASIATGLLTPGGCALVIGTMTVAAGATTPNGFWAAKGGCEVPFCYGALAVVVGFGGPGALSLDNAVGLPAVWGPWWGVAALLVGVAAAVVPLTRRARELHSRTVTSDPRRASPA